MTEPPAIDFFRASQAFREDFSTLGRLSTGAQFPRRVILDASAALRRLLFEQLIDHVNRHFRLKLTFTCREFPATDELFPNDDVARALGMPQEVVDSGREQITYWQGPSLDPNRTNHPVFPTAEVTLTRDQWLAHTVAIVQGQPVSVRDHVRLIANVMEGVHLGAPKGRQQEHAVIHQALFDSLAQGGDGGPGRMVNGPVRQVVFIAGVTYTGLIPLAAELLRKPK